MLLTLSTAAVSERHKRAVVTAQLSARCMLPTQEAGISKARGAAGAKFSGCGVEQRHAEKLVLPQHGKSVARVWPWVWQGCGIVASVAGPGHRRQGVAQAK